MMDFLGATLGMLLTWPFFLGIAVAIRLESPGRVFFVQERLGRGGAAFRVWKFRTMREDATDSPHRKLFSSDQDASPAEVNGADIYKLTDDPRVTRVGSWLRRTSMDELPQLINVLRGEMSLVGPRPLLAYEYNGDDDWRRERLHVRPGMTGLWQVSGRSHLSHNRMCELDVRYAREWSLWLDMRILAQTLPVVLFNSGRAS